MRNLPLLFLVGLASGFISDKLWVSSQAPLTTADDLYLEGHTSGDLPIDDEDREDGDGSGSGSGDYAFIDLELQKILNFSKTTDSKEMFPGHPEPTPDSPQPSTTTTTAAVITPTTEDTDETTFFSWDEEAGHPDLTPSSAPPSETTSRDVAVARGKEDEEDNSLDQWERTTAKHPEDEILIERNDNNIVYSAGRDSRMFDSPKGVSSENLWDRTEVLAAVIACGVVGFLCAVFLLLLLAYRMKKKDEGSYDLGDTKLSTTAYHKAPTKEFYA